MDNDFFLYDHERLTTIASDKAIREGLACFKEDRVFDFEWSDAALWARVEGNERGGNFTVELIRNEHDQLMAQCDCAGDAVCEHAVALLYRYAAHCDVVAAEDALGGALEEALQERIRKGKNEVMVKQLTGELGFGTWQASSIASATYWKQVYQVHIRSLEQRINFCTCPDLASNQLGTCKHIEAVLNRINKEPDCAVAKQAGAPVSFIYLEWVSATEPVIQLHRAATCDEALNTLLAPFFNSAGRFTGQLPDDFFRLSERVYGREDIELGEDALRHARQCAADAANLLRQQQITHEIMRSGGVLPGIHARLYPYQIEGVAFLASRGRALLADDMGLGKTLQAIAAAAWMAQKEEIKRILVVCPASLKHQWAREIERFTNHTATIIQGPAQTRQVQYRTDALFVIANYELVMRDLTVINENLRPDLLILDEAQRIKNWQTKIASTVKLITTRHAFVLTGTPLENRLQDLYSLLQVIDARVLGPLWRCMIDFHVTDERGKVIGYRNLSELRRRIASVMLRRDRRLVSDQLPDRTEVRLDIALSDRQRGLHDDAMAAAGRLAMIAKRRPLTPSERNRLMAALQQARMACNAAGLVDKETKGSPKLEELARLLEDLCLQSSRKVVIFSQWERMTAMVESLARSMALGCVRLHGGVPTAKRGALMDRFRDDDAIQLFISTDAGGVGLNLQAASVLINLDMPWNPAVLDQRIARVHRLGQKQKVQIFLLMAEDSYEERVASLVAGKRNLFDNVVDPDASEDVVGVSNKMLQTIIEEFVGEPVASEPSTGMPSVAVDEAEAGSPVKSEKDNEAELDSAVRDTIERVQQAFDARIERILGAGGGLLVVLDQVDDEAAVLAQSLSDIVPVALIEARTLSGLQRLGAASPVTAGPVLFQSEEGSEQAESLLARRAREKLHAAEVLIEQHCAAGVVELLASAMLLAAVAKTGATKAPSLEEASVWIYVEAVPQGLMQPDQATALTRAITLVTAPCVPADLMNQIVEDARLMVGPVAGQGR